jgi:ribosomal protein S18 acetylase RimI-like enzyme
MSTIRPFTTADLPALRAVLAAIGWAPQYVQGQLNSFQGLSADPHGHVLVAEADGEVVGFVTVLFAAWNRLAQVHGLAVVPSRQRQGLATALLAAAEVFARGLGARGVYVDTPVDNLTARDFYRANGYREAYVMPEYYAEGLDGVTYLKLFAKPS